MKLRNKLIATIVSISMVLAVIGVGAWASTESFTATITNTVNLEFDNVKGSINLMAAAGLDNQPEGRYCPGIQEILCDNGQVIYDTISSDSTSGTNLYWEGTQFFDGSDEGLDLVNNETEAAAVGYLFQYEPTEDCDGKSNITIMINEQNAPEITGGLFLVKYFASVDFMNWTELFDGVAVTPIADDEIIVVIAVLQYYNQEGNSITTIAGNWDFSVTFAASGNEIAPLTGTIQIDADPSDGIVLAADYESASTINYEIIEMGSYPQTLKAANVTITDAPTDSNGYYTGSDGEKYGKITANVGANAQRYKMNVASDGTVMNNGEEYYFKVEPIKWRVIYEENGEVLLVAHNILFGTHYYAGTNLWTSGERPEDMIDGDYMYSDLRYYLSLLYSSHFTSDEKQQILSTTLDNGSVILYDDGGNEYEYVCQDTTDYVFALSNDELDNTEYGFSENAVDLAKHFEPTDYAKAMGVENFTEEYLEGLLAQANLSEAELKLYRSIYQRFLGAGEVWTRTPYPYYRDMVYEILHWGGITDNEPVDSVGGALPAMRITR